MKYVFTLVLFLMMGQYSLRGQAYTSYFTGSVSDVSPAAYGGICLMGGASENDNAMAWFLQQANGGDILVLRASGSDGYNDYLYEDLGVTVNSVETIKFNSASAASDPYIHQRIQQAEGIWFAGGDQWDYVSYWRGTAVDSLINLAISERNIVIGGTSAGMAIQGGYYFSAENGTVTSATALDNPYDSSVKVAHEPFIKNEFLADVITDTHYDNPDRRGRHTVFLARILTDLGLEARGIACDEYTAVCINQNGLAFVYGDYPSNNDNAYFIQPNCELDAGSPETCSSGVPLHWNHDGKALKVCVVKGTNVGLNTFDLNNWQTSSGGSWEHWSVFNSILSVSDAEAPDCTPSAQAPALDKRAALTFSNPVSGSLNVKISSDLIRKGELRLRDTSGIILLDTEVNGQGTYSFSVQHLPKGIYILELLEGEDVLLIEKVHISNY